LKNSIFAANFAVIAMYIHERNHWTDVQGKFLYPEMSAYCNRAEIIWKNYFG